jgi:hypothetical protein
MTRREARHRRRRIVVQYDAHGQLGAPFAEWLAFRFHCIDTPGSMIDSIIWDIGWGSWAAYPSEVLPRFEHAGMKLWRQQGIDWVGELVRATRERGLECFWNHRVSEVDINPLDLERDTELMMDHLNPVKAARPDWVIKTWWWQGLWNYAVPEVREYNLAILRELAHQYDLDGFQLDFARHIPCLPVGRQWELREGVTEFVRMVRGMLDEAAAQRGKPYLLATRIPNTLESCRADGFDVWTWAQEDLVDILTLGSRSMSVDVAGFREAVGGAPPPPPPAAGAEPYRSRRLEGVRWPVCTCRASGVTAARGRRDGCTGPDSPRPSTVGPAVLVGRRPRTADRRPRTADRRPRTADRRPRTADRRPRTADRRPRTTDRRPRRRDQRPERRERESMPSPTV